MVVGRTEGLWWEISSALMVVERARLLFFFPYASIPHRSGSRIADFWEFIARWNLPRRRYNQMNAERRERYRECRDRVASQLNCPLPEELGDALFLDFLPDGKVRRLDPRHNSRWKSYAFGVANPLVDYWPFRLSRLRFDMRGTLRPFLAKLHAEAEAGAHYDARS